jgi:hypothetical protein
MLLAWVDPQLQSRCCVPGGFGPEGSRHRGAAEDLMSTVVAAPALGGLLEFRSIDIRISAGGVVLTLEEVQMHMQLLRNNGEPRSLPAGSEIAKHAAARSALINDVRLGGLSLRRAT